jgi:hypothetical protein
VQSFDFVVVWRKRSSSGEALQIYAAAIERNFRQAMERFYSFFAIQIHSPKYVKLSVSKELQAEAPRGNIISRLKVIFGLLLFN